MLLYKEKKKHLELVMFKCAELLAWLLDALRYWGSLLKT